MDAAIMDLYIEQINRVMAVEIIGEIDSVTSNTVHEQIIPLAEQGSPILLDMSQVNYLSSAGLRALLLIYRKVHENSGKLVISGLSDEVKDIMSITGFLDYFATVNSRQEALQKLA